MRSRLDGAPARGKGRGVQDHRAGLLALRDRLEGLGVRQVAMEATGVYWKPVWAVLEDSFALTLVNARHVEAVRSDCPTAIWRTLQTGELCSDPGNDYSTRQNPDRTTKRLVRQLEALGHTVTLEPREVAA